MDIFIKETGELGFIPFITIYLLLPIFFIYITYLIIRRMFPSIGKNRILEYLFLGISCFAFIPISVIWLLKGWPNFASWANIIPDKNYPNCFTIACVQIVQERDRNLLTRRIQEQLNPPEERPELGKFHIAEAERIDLYQWGQVWETETEIQQDRKEKAYKGKYVIISGGIYDIDEIPRLPIFKDENRPGSYQVTIEPLGLRKYTTGLYAQAICEPTTKEEEELLFTKSEDTKATIVGKFKSYGDWKGIELEDCSVIE